MSGFFASSLPPELAGEPTLHRAAVYGQADYVRLCTASLFAKDPGHLRCFAFQPISLPSWRADRSPGSTSRNVEPLPFEACALMRALRESPRSIGAIASPRPVPPVSRVRPCSTR